MSLDPSRAKLEENIGLHYNRLLAINRDLMKKGLDPANINIFKDDKDDDFGFSLETSTEKKSGVPKLTVRVKRGGSEEEVYIISYKDGERASIHKRGRTLSMYNRINAEDELGKVLHHVEDALDGFSPEKAKLPAVPASVELKQTAGIVKLLDQVSDIIHRSIGSQGFGQFGEGEAYVYSGHRRTLEEGGMAARTELDLADPKFNFIIAKTYAKDANCIRVLIVNPDQDKKITFLIDPRKEMPLSLRIFSEERFEVANFQEPATSEPDAYGVFLRQGSEISAENFYKYLARMQAGFSSLLMKSKTSSQ